MNRDLQRRIEAFPPWPSYDEDEIEAVRHVLESGNVNYWTGNECRLFEEEFAQYLGRNHAISVANGTLALELALYAFHIGRGDEVIVPARTFIATASCVVAQGATPVVADVDCKSGNVTSETIERHINSRTKAIIVVHLAGWPCDMDSILTLARKHGLKVIEDCAQAHGATYKGCPVGSFGNAAAFSFCQDKIMTTGGEGGMLLLDDEDAWSRAWSYKDHGKSYEAVFLRDHPPGFRWLHESFGSNWRMTEMQAAIGRIQLKKLNKWVARRCNNAALLRKCFEAIDGLNTPVPAPEFGHSYYKFYAYLNPAMLKSDWDQIRIMNAIQAGGIPCYTGSCSEIYMEKAFQNAGLGPQGHLPNAKRLGERSLMFLVHPTLGKQEMLDTCSVVRHVMGRATISSK